VVDDDLESHVLCDVAGLERLAANAARRVPGVVPPRGWIFRVMGCGRRPKARVVRNRRGTWVIHMKVIAVYGYDLGVLGEAVQSAVRTSLEARGEAVEAIVVRIAGVKVPRKSRLDVQEGKAT
jgi:uncharacterized alkaline shock family protein YloU